MSEESFYGATLTGENNKVFWDVLSNNEEFPRAQKLIIKQILLGADAKENEYNVVEAETVKNTSKIPIAVLKAGETRAANPNIEFWETSVTFRLVQGNGPVYLHGQNVKDDVEAVDWDGEESEEEDELVEEEEAPPKKKAKIGNHVDNANK